MKVRLICKWYDFWVGVFFDRGNRRIYILPLPCLGVVIQLPYASDKHAVVVAPFKKEFP